MARRNELLYALNAGGVDAEALSRIDLEKLRLAGVHPVANWLPRVLGPMSLRPGLEHMAAVNAVTRMVEFVRDSSTTAILMFQNANIFVYQSGAPVMTVASASTVLNPTFSAALSGSFATGWRNDSETGDGTDGAAATGSALILTATKYRSASVQQSVAIAGGDQASEHTVRIDVTRGPVFVRMGTSQDSEDLLTEQRLLTGTHKLTVTPGAALLWIKIRSEDAETVRIVSRVQFEHILEGGAGPIFLPSPYLAADLPFLAWDQGEDSDVLFIGDGRYQERRIERRGPKSWSIVLYQTRRGPFSRPSTDKVRLTPSTYLANGTLTSNLPYFKASHVGTLFELTHNEQHAIEELNGVNQATGKITVRGLFSSTKPFDDRNFGYGVDMTTGTFVGTIALERSTDIDAQVWTVVETFSATVSPTAYNDEQSNLLCHYRLRVTGYTSGYALVNLDYLAGSTTGIVRITAFTNSMSVTYEVMERIGGVNATDDWRGPMWSDDLGWPRVPKLRDDRLHWFFRDRDFASNVDDYDNYDDSVEGDSGPIIRSVGGEVRWALSMDRLVIGTSSRVSAIQASDFNEVVTPTSWSVRPGPTLGAGYVPPVQIDDTAIMSDKTGTRLYDVTVPDGAAKLKSSDLSRMLPNGFGSGIVDIAVQRQPDTRVYIVMGDGSCIVLTFEREDKVVAFTTITSAAALIKDVCILPGERQDEIYFMVDRGGALRLERLGNETDQKSKSTCTLLDGYRVLTGSVSSITGATHMAGWVVNVWADGFDRGTVTLNGSGVAALGATYARVVYGLAYSATFESVKLAYAAQLGSAVGQTKQVKRVSPILSNSVLDGIRIGMDAANADPFPAYIDGAQRTTGQFFTHFDEDSFAIPGRWDADSRIYIKADSNAGPVTIQAIAIDIETREGIDASNRN